MGTFRNMILETCKYSIFLLVKRMAKYYLIGRKTMGGRGTDSKGMVFFARKNALTWAKSQIGSTEYARSAHRRLETTIMEMVVMVMVDMAIMAIGTMVTGQPTILAAISRCNKTTSIH